MANPELSKAYDPSQTEDQIYAFWEKGGFFNPDSLPDTSGRSTESFSIVLPPPNVTGTLHLGHAVMLALEDAMVRFARMRGKRTLWIPGTDHAAIATQAKVEKILRAEGMVDPRRELGREDFLKRVEAFAAASHDTIVNQARKMGASLDWSREAYTLDAVRTKAVRAAFTKMYNDGLIYRGHRVVNWCPHCRSTLADDEVEYKEGTAKLFTFRYDSAFPFPISTTRPETKFGDVAVAVHPEDERYKEYVGKTIEAYFCGKQLSIRFITDRAVDPAFGTGALGVTPAHSHIDAEMARENDLSSPIVIGEDGTMREEAGSEVAGLSILQAREKVVGWLRGAGLMEKEEDVPQNLSVCYRCGNAIEPLPKLQWFIGVNRPFKFRASTHAPIEGISDGQEVTLKQLMQHVVRTNQIQIVPDRFTKTYFHWIDNLRDWNISRQIWFGHRVPVWYRKNIVILSGAKNLSGDPSPLQDVGVQDDKKNEEVYVGVEAPKGDGWEQDPDTLDTWFSSGLWTLSTLGWPSSAKASEGKPDNASDFQTYHPMSILETGYDILFFWVARMILMTTYAVGEVPFEKVYLHGLVRDEQGRKMSKSLGNVIDPLDMIGKYGADATRLALVIGSTPGNDMKMSEEKIAGYRNFTNKLWNISRFVFLTVGNIHRVSLKEIGMERTLADRWILSRYSETVRCVTGHFERDEYSAAGEVLRDFTWNDFADWYVEIAKIERQRPGAVTDAVLLSVLEGLLALWHPFMPFITEEIWKAFEDPQPFIIHPWPEALMISDGDIAQEQFGFIRDLIVAVRNLRAQHKMPPADFVSLLVASPEKESLVRDQSSLVERLARVKEMTFIRPEDAPEGAATAVLGSTRLFVPVSAEATRREQIRLQKELEEAEGYLAGLDRQLSNEAFVARAPEAIVVSIRQKREEAVKKVEGLRQQLSNL